MYTVIIRIIIIRIIIILNWQITYLRVRNLKFRKCKNIFQFSFDGGGKNVNSMSVRQYEVPSES